ncbi:uncharacterized protein FIBRA_07524 [Fibroporia radiculosa]|uniref:Uncharacterized protein n=1 Tax=Fibroporia radiculosa TaxID=599839 RepID=J4GV52_9APHY|nr:uncharacterized protein FIBRA_07524 [Fibroporia radiculosa]CCM05310.1 predicted protein [Fibroporia radiculosa]
MAPQASTSSDDEAPEAFTFGSSKKAAQDDQITILKFEAAEKSKKKQKNRERDRVLKERAELAKANLARKRKSKSKGKEKAVVAAEASEGGNAGGRNNLESRMERAMREAEDESDLDDKTHGMGAGSRIEGDDSDGIGGGSEGGEEDIEMSGDDREEGSGLLDKGSYEDEEADDSFSQHFTVSNNRYLPDHLFSSALSKPIPKPSSKRKLDLADTPEPPALRRKRAKHPSKDINIGSRTIRTMSSPSLAVPSVTPRAMVPPPKVNRFFKKSLNVNGNANSAKAKGWERRSANVGVMKRNGPAASFVRNR